MHVPSRCLYHIHYINSCSCRNFLIDGYGIFLSLCHTISYLRTMCAYDLILYVSFTFVSTLDLIFSPSVSIIDSITSCFDTTLTTFPTRHLVEGGPICRVSTCFHSMITSLNFANMGPCRDFVKKYVSMCSMLHYSIEILLISTTSLANR